MAASDYDYNATRNEIIARAFRIVGAIEPGQSPSAAQLAQGIQALNELVKSWQDRGIFLWSLSALTLSLTNPNATYTPTDPILWIESPRLRISNVDYPLELVSFRTYTDNSVFSNKATTGRPTHIAVYPQATPQLIVWPVPDQSYTLYYNGVIKLRDFDSSSQNFDGPVRFVRALAYGLAADLVDEYSPPLGEAERIQDKAERLFLQAKASDSDREDNSFVQGSYRAGR